MNSRTDRNKSNGSALTGRRRFLKNSLLLAGAAPFARAMAAPGDWQIDCYTRPWNKFDYPGSRRPRSCR